MTYVNPKSTYALLNSRFVNAIDKNIVGLTKINTISGCSKTSNRLQPATYTRNGIENLAIKRSKIYKNLQRIWNNAKCKRQNAKQLIQSLIIKHQVAASRSLMPIKRH